MKTHLIWSWLWPSCVRGWNTSAMGDEAVSESCVSDSHERCLTGCSVMLCCCKRSENELGSGGLSCDDARWSRRVWHFCVMRWHVREAEYGWGGRWYEFLWICVSGWFHVWVDCEPVTMVVCGKKWGHACIIACGGGVSVCICMCVTISIPSGLVVALEIGSTYPCWTDGGQLDAPMQSQPNLEHWHRVQVTFPIYPWLPLPSGRAVPAITSSLLLPSNLLCSQLPTTP